MMYHLVLWAACILYVVNGKYLFNYAIVIYITLYILYIYLFHTQSTHIDKSYINSNTIIHIINDKYIIMSGHISVNKILRNNHI